MADHPNMPHSPIAAPPSNEELACRAQTGCLASFDELIMRWQSPLLRFLRHRGATAADADDLAQETFVRAFERLDQYRPSSAFSTWLFTIAHRLSINQRRQKRPVADSAAIESIETTLPPPEQSLADEENRRNLWELAAVVLSEEQCSALWLHYVEEMSVKQIAEVLGRSRIGVRTIMFRARQKLLPHLRRRQAQGTSDDRTAAAQSSPRRRTVGVIHV